MNYFRRLIDKKDPADAKRFLGLVMSAFLIVAFFVLLFTKVEKKNADLLDKAMLYAFLIVLMSLFNLAVDTVGLILLQVSKAKAAAQILSPGNSTTVNKVENVQGDINGPAADKQPGDEVFESDETEMKNIKRGLTNSLKQNSEE